MNPQSLPLRDIHLPPDPGFWPLAPGWWIVLGGLLALLVFGLWRWRASRLRRARLKSVRKILREISLHYARHQDAHRLAQGLSDLLRRHVRHILGDVRATRLSGRAWAEYLNGLLPAEQRSPRQIERWQALEQAVFNPHVPGNQAKQWLDDVERVIEASVHQRKANRKKTEDALV